MDIDLVKLLNERAVQRYPPELRRLVVGRLETERNLAHDAGVLSELYALVRLALEIEGRQIPVWSSGSESSSLVLYLAGLTRVEPMRNGLRFERYCHGLRKGLPALTLFCLPRDYDRARECLAGNQLPSGSHVYRQADESSIPFLAESLDAQLFRQSTAKTVAGPEIWGCLANGSPEGVFLMDCVELLDAVLDRPPASLSDFAALNAAFIQSRLSDQQVEPWIVDHQVRSRLLKDTAAESFGVILFQEQIMDALNRVGGIGLQEGYWFCREAAKAKESCLEGVKERFLRQAVRNGLSPVEALDCYEELRRVAWRASCKARYTADAEITGRALQLRLQAPCLYSQAVRFQREPYSG